MILLRTLRNLITSVPTISWTIHAMVKVLLLLDKDGQFLGATWFLGALFYVSIVYKLCDALLGKRTFKYIFITLFFVLIAMLGFAVNFPYLLSRTLVLSMFYALGYMVRVQQAEFKKIDSPITAALCLALFMIIATHNSANMGQNEYTNPVLFVIGAYFASYFMIWLSAIIDRFQVREISWLLVSLSFFGKRSLDILIWQFVFFRVVIVAQLLLSSQPISMLLDYYPILSPTHGWWIAYTMAGVMLPILWCDLLRVGPWGSFLKQVHAV